MAARRLPQLQACCLYSRRRKGSWQQHQGNNNFLRPPSPFPQQIFPLSLWSELCHLATHNCRAGCDGGYLGVGNEAGSGSQQGWHSTACRTLESGHLQEERLTSNTPCQGGRDGIHTHPWVHFRCRKLLVLQIPPPWARPKIGHIGQWFSKCP